MPMPTPRERLLEWLRDAHAMEEQAEQMLSSTAKRLDDYPDLQAKLEEHLQATRGQARRIKGCIQRLGSSTSMVKDVAGRMIAIGQGLSGMFVSDVEVKAALAVYTFEHMEVGSYRILIEAAELAGDAHTKAVCEEILREEEAMAAWLAGQLASVTRQHVMRESAPAAAEP